MRDKLDLLIFFGITYSIIGCATSTTTLQSARTLEPKEIQITTAVSVPVSTRMVGAVIDTAEATAKEINEAAHGNQELTTEEARKGVESAAALALFTPSAYPEALFRIGIADRFDAGLKLSYSLIKPELKFQYLRIEDGIDASVFMGYAFHFDIGPSIAAKVYDIFDSLELADYSRHDLDFGLLFGKEWKDIVSLYWGVRYLLSFINVDFGFKQIKYIDGEAIPDLGVHELMHNAGAVIGVMAGYKYVFVNVELTLLYCIFKPEIIEREMDLSGMIIAPTLGITTRF